MWLFCKSGFFSAVQHSKLDGMMHVRARFEGDLERIAKKYRIALDVIHTPSNDYPYRADISRTDWIKVVKGETIDIHYENFKNEVHDGTSRDQAYMAVWSAMRRNSCS